MDGTFESGKRPPHDTCARKNVRHGLSYRNAKWVFYFLALLGFCNTWGRTVIDGSLGLLLKALDRRERYILPGTQERVRTCVTRLYWPFDYLLNILIIFFWEAVDGSHPSTSATGIYFLGQYFSILVSMHIDASRLGNARQWKLA